MRKYLYRQSKSEDKANSPIADALLPYRHTNLCSSVRWCDTLYLIKLLSTCVPCTTGMVQASDLPTVLTCIPHVPQSQPIASANQSNGHVKSMDWTLSRASFQLHACMYM